MRIKGIKVQQGIKIKAVVLPRPGPPVSRPKPFVLARQESWKRASLYCAVSTRISLEFFRKGLNSSRLKLSFREAAYLFRLGEETFLGGEMPLREEWAERL